MKGQITLEFTGSMIFFLIVLVSALTITLSDLPQFYDQTESTEKHLEAKSFSDTLLTWDEEPGLASKDTDSKYLSLNKTRISEVNFSEINSSLNPEFTYYLNFTEYEIVETHNTFVRGNPPDNTWVEPDDSCYNNAQNIVHYNNAKTFLVVACSGDYDRVYNTTNPKDFNTSNSYAKVSTNLDASDIQNRPNEPGASFVIERKLGSISSTNRDTLEDLGERIKLNRYAYTNENSLVKVEVIAW